MNINSQLKEYIEQNIFPQYIKNDEGHQIDHIKYVIDRCYKLSKNMDIDFDMLYVIAAFHDIGYYKDAQNHEKISARMMCTDEFLKAFFDENQLKIMKEAIEDHRASLDRFPRSIYGKLLSSADRNVDVDESLKRIYIYSITYFPRKSEDETIAECYEHTLKKFSKKGYAKFFLKDEEYEKYLQEMQHLLQDKKLFCERLNKIIASIQKNR